MTEARATPATRVVEQYATVTTSHFAVVVRDARDEDGWELTGLIAACWAEYPGCILDVHGESRWLLAPATTYAANGGRLWVAEQHGRIIGSVGVAPAAPSGGDTAERGAELRALYVAKHARRQGLATRLVQTVEGDAKRRGASRIELWSDTRFIDAHRLYERLEYERLPETRPLHDISHSVEYHFRKEL